ncbi:hypothetical protein [Pontibacter beigongshangensis]|uniref:hypothetical protein n=1 Tax=Pontibacter beigongshangensis TaxID=2574733 RepID=UPI001650B0DA|nr:hypothetical protein [Pontibacter beigongshangensis]
MIYLVFYTVLLAVLEIFRDGYAIINGTYSSRQNLSHRYAWCSRALAIAVPTVVLFGLTLKAGANGLILGLIFWLVFDTGLNVKRGLHPFYVGQNASTDKAIRRTAQKLGIKPEHLSMYLKIGILIALITGYALG